MRNHISLQSCTAEAVPARNRTLGLGLVLGAGGIRGCAHAGVIQALLEEALPIDVVVGASVGSIFGLGLAAGLPTEYLARVAREANPAQMLRFYAGRLRPGNSNPIGRMLNEAGAGRTFADLSLPFAVLTTDMATGRPVVIDTGPVLPAVQASIAVPFIARPVPLNGRFLVDGGLLYTAPVSVARDMGARRVLAVCLGYNYLAPRTLRKRPWTRRVVESLGKRPPKSGSLLDQVRFAARLLEMSYERPLPAQDADVAIWPEFGKVGPNSMFGASFCFQQGIDAAREALPRVRNLVTESRHDLGA